MYILIFLKVEDNLFSYLYVLKLEIKGAYKWICIYL